MRNFVAGVAGLATCLVAKSAWAAFHIMQVTEVFPGTTQQPDAQYIELQMYAAGQNLVNGHTVTVFDAAGTMVMTYTFAANVASGANQSTILIATTEAAALFGVTPDLTMTPTIALAGGKVCFENIDCVAWGNYTGPATPSQVGVPAYQALGLIVGRSLTRKLGANNMLEGADDTDISSADFERALPTPRNNAGTVPTIPTNTCGDNAITGLESCDDGNTNGNDGCSTLCVTESCGDGLIQQSESCDDTNTNNTDACGNTCIVQTPAVDGAPDAAVSPAPDAGGEPTGDGGGCCETGGAGASPLLALLVLGMLRRRRLS